MVLSGMSGLRGVDMGCGERGDAGGDQEGLWRCAGWLWASWVRK